MARTTAALLALVLAAGCGGEDERRPAATVGDPTGTPYVSLREAEAVLEQTAGLEVVRTGIAATASSVPQPAAGTRYEDRSGTEFDVLVLPNPALARDAVPEVEGEVVRGANVLAVFEGPSAVRDRVRRAFDVLGAACAGRAEGDVPDEVSDACSPAESPGTPGTDEPAAEGNEVELGGVAYRVVTARQLNPAIPPDEQLAAGLQTPAGRTLVAVVLEACATDGPAVPDARMRLMTAFGEDYGPLDVEPAVLAFEPRPLEEGECTPEEGSVAARTIDGGALVFRIPFEAFEDRPLTLRLIDGNERRELAVDL